MTATVYSKFGTQANTESGTYFGQQGPPGIGFDLDINGNYDVQNRSFVNADDMQLNTISALGTTIGLVNKTICSDDLVVENQIKVEDTLNQTMMPNAHIHIETNGTANLVVEGDKDNSGASDRSIISMLVNGKNDMAQLSLEQNNTVKLLVGDSFDPVAGTFIVGTAQTVTSGSNLPTFSNETDHFKFNVNGNESYRNLIMNSNNISGIGTISGAGASAITSNSDINMNSNDITNLTSVSGVGASAITSNSDINMLDNTLVRVAEIQGPLVGNLSVTSNLNMNANNLIGINEVQTSVLTDTIGGTGNVSVFTDLNLLGKQVNGVTTISGWGVNPIVSASDIDMNNNDLLQVSTIQGPNGGVGNLAILSNMNMSNNNITNIGDISINGIIKNIGAPNIEVGDDISMLTNDIINIGTASGTTLSGWTNISGTTGTFTNLTVNGNIDLTQGNIDNLLQINNSTGDITVTPLGFLIMASQKSIALQDGFLSITNSLGSVPGTPAGFQGFVYKFGTDLFYKSGAGTYNLIDPFYTRSTVTQTGSMSAGVTINQRGGFIQCFNFALGSFSFVQFTVTNSTVTTNSIVHASLCGYSGSGLPVVQVDNIAAGSFRIRVHNSHNTLALTAAVKLCFTVF